MPNQMIWDDFHPGGFKFKEFPMPEPEVKVEAKVLKVSQPEYQKELILICGLPGSGKSTLARYLKTAFQDFFNVSTSHFEADQFFVDLRCNYKFDGAKLQEAHEWCQLQVKKAMTELRVKVIVSNTSINKRQREPYIRLAKEYGYSIQTIICRGEFESIHGVPSETIRRMSKAFEY